MTQKTKQDLSKLDVLINNAAVFLDNGESSLSVEMEIINGSLVLTPIENIREGWSESFQSMAVNGDDQLSINDALGTVEDEDWEW